MYQNLKDCQYTFNFILKYISGEISDINEIGNFKYCLVIDLDNV
jgi:hypothetical protein